MARVLLFAVAAVIAAVAAFWLIASVLHLFFYAVMIVLVVALVFGMFRAGRRSARSRSRS